MPLHWQTGFLAEQGEKTQEESADVPGLAAHTSLTLVHALDHMVVALDALHLCGHLCVQKHMFPCRTWMKGP